MTDEIWVPISYHGRYEVSNMGRVRNTRTGAILKPMMTGQKRKQYATVRLPVGDLKVHRLVLEHFVGPRPEGAVSRHLNDNSSDNRASNLAWGTLAENAADTHNNFKGHRQILTTAQALEIKTRRAAGELGTALAKEFGVTSATVCDIHKGRYRPL